MIRIPFQAKQAPRSLQDNLTRPSQIKWLRGSSSLCATRPSLLPGRAVSKDHRFCFAGIVEVFEVADVVSAGKTLIELGLGGGILAALSWSSLPLLSGKASSYVRKDVNEEDAIGIKWGVMSVLSFLPLFNWLAWIFAAFEDSDRASFYYVLALLYGLPQLNAGFQQNWFSIATIIAGILHVQAERLADERGIKKSFSLDSSLQDAPSQATKFLQATSKTFSEAIQTNLDKEEQKEALEDDEDGATEELKQWDQRFRKKK